MILLLIIELLASICSEVQVPFNTEYSSIQLSQVYFNKMENDKKVIQIFKYIPNKQDQQEKSLIVMLDDMSFQKQTQIFIFKNKLPSEKIDLADIVCLHNSQYYCVVPNLSQQDGQDNFYLFVINCQEKCIYRFKIDYQMFEYQLKMNDFLYLWKGHEKFRLNVLIDEFELNEIELEIMVTNVQREQYFGYNEFRFFLNDQEFKQITVIEGTRENEKSILIKKESLKQGDVLSMEILAYLTNQLKVEVKKLQQITTMNLNQKYVGIQQIKQEKHFKIFLTQEEYKSSSILIFVIKISVGQATVYANQIYQPILLSQYKYQLNVYETKQISIPLKNLTDNQAPLFYLSVYPQSLCQYELYSYIEDRLNFQIQVNQVFKNTIQQNEVVNLKFSLKEKIFVIDCVTKADVIIAKCQESNCIINKEIFESKITGNEKIKLLFFNSGQEQYTIQVDNHDYELSDDNFFVISLYLQNDIVKDDFSILVNSPEYSLELIENVPKKIIGCEDFDYNFYFILEPQEKPFKLNFILTSLSGQQMFKSKSQNYMGRAYFQFVSLNNQILYDISAPQENTFYKLMVQSEIFGSFTMLAVFDREDDSNFGNLDIHYILLQQGLPQDFIFHKLEQNQNKTRIVLFKAYLKGSMIGINEKVTFTVKPQSDSIKIFGFNKPSKNTTHSLWQSKERLVISASDINFPDVLYLRIETQSDLTIKVLYQLSNKPTFLRLNQNYMGNIDIEEVQRFELDLYTFENLIFYKFATPNKNTNHLKLALKYSSKMVIREENQFNQVFDAETCPGTNSSHYHCKVEIHISSQINTQYQILVEQSDQSQLIQLYEGEQIFKQLFSNVPNYYFIQTKREDLNINLKIFEQNEKLQIRIYFNSFDESYFRVQNLEKLLIIYQQLFEVQDNIQIFISKEQFIDQFECISICSLYLQLILFAQNDILLDLHINYMIQYNKQFQFLQENELLNGKGMNFSIQYYKFDIYLQSTNIMVILSPKSECEVDLFISKNQYPSSQIYDWISNEYLGDRIQIQAGNPIHPESAGSYYVAVYTQQQNVCEYQIGYSIEELLYYKIQLNQPFHILLKKNEIVYLEYNHRGRTYEEAFILKNQNKGQAVFFLDSYEKIKFDQQFIHQNSYSNFFYNNSGLGYSKSFKFMVSSSFVYLLALKAIVDSNVVIGISTFNQDINLPKNEQIMNDVVQGVEHNYQFISSGEIELHIEVLTGSLEVKQQIGQLFYRELLIEKYFLYATNNYTFRLSNSDKNYYRIKLISKEISTYSIEYNDESERELKFNTLYTFLFRQNSVKKFFCQTIDESSIITFTIEVEVGKQFKSHNHQANNDQPYLLIYQGQDYQDLATPSSQYVFNNIFYSEFQELKGKFIIKLISQSNSPIKFNVIIGNTEIKNLNTISSLIATQSVKEASYWEYYCPSEGRLIIQINSCKRKVQGYGSRDLLRLKSSQYDDQFLGTPNANIFNIKIVDKGPYFISTQIKEEFKNQGTTYLPIQIFASFITSEIYINLKDLKEHSFKHQLIQQEDRFLISFQIEPLQTKNITQQSFSIQNIEYSLIYEINQFESINSSLNICIPENKISVLQIRNFTDLIELYAQFTQEQVESFKHIVATIQARVTIIVEKQEKIVFLYQYPQVIVKNEFILTHQIETQSIFPISNYIFAVTFIIILIILLIKIFQLRNATKLDISNNDTIEMSYKSL